MSGEVEEGRDGQSKPGLSPGPRPCSRLCTDGTPCIFSHHTGSALPRELRGVRHCEVEEHTWTLSAANCVWRPVFNTTSRHFCGFETVSFWGTTLCLLWLGGRNRPKAESHKWTHLRLCVCVCSPQHTHKPTLTWYCDTVGVVYSISGLSVWKGGVGGAWCHDAFPCSVEQGPLAQTNIQHDKWRRAGRVGDEEHRHCLPKEKLAE